MDVCWPPPPPLARNLDAAATQERTSRLTGQGVAR